MEGNDILEDCKKFLEKSSDYFSPLVTRKRRDMEIFSGSFWSEKLIVDTDRTGRINRQFSQYPKFVNTIVSPFSKSPYHAQIDDPDGIYKIIQDSIDEYENKFDYKNSNLAMIRSAAITGVGYIVLSIVNGKIVPEIVRDVSQVAVDPFATDMSLNDSEAGAIVNFISTSKARRLYGNDICDSKGSCFLDNFGTQWERPTDAIAVISYYKKNENNTVDFYKLCGDKIVSDKIELPISRIPIFRCCFNEVIRNRKVDYSGIVDLTKDLQLGLNLGYSTLLERMNRSPKANFMMPAKAIDGLEEYYKKLQTKESLVCLYNGDTAPTAIVESYQTQDLMSTIDTCNNLMSQVIGIPVGGINPAMNSQTATEILVQQNNSESNVNNLYENASHTIREITNTIIEALCFENKIDQVPVFKLINGPTIITQNMKRRQELQAIAQLVDDKTKTIVAREFVKTLDKEIKDTLLPDMTANLPQDVQLVSDSTEKEDPRAVHTLNQMQGVLNSTQDELEKQVNENKVLQQQIAQLQLSLLDQKQKNSLELLKIQNDRQLAETKLSMDSQNNKTDNIIKLSDNKSKADIENIKLQKEVISLEAKKAEIAKKAMENTNGDIQ